MTHDNVTDIVERLRAETRYDEPNWKACMAERDEAADTIATLRKQLDMLGMLENEPVREICLASAGALVGSLTPGIIGLVHLANEPENFTLADMISMLVLITATVLTVVTGLAWVMRAKAKPKLVATIRARPKVSVRISNDIIA